MELLSIILPPIISALGAGGLIKFFIERKDKKKAVQVEEKEKQTKKEKKESEDRLMTAIDNKMQSMIDNSKQLGEDMTDRMDKIESTLRDHIEMDKEGKADASRQRILRFCDDVYNIGMTREHYETILIDIDKYEDYCREHENYKNEKCANAISYIRRSYQKCLDEHSFKEYE